jgi:hypothetical protein
MYQCCGSASRCCGSGFDISTNADPDLSPDSNFYLMRIQIFILCGTRFLFYADPDSDADPGHQNEADPDPKHCHGQNRVTEWELVFSVDRTE